MGEQVITLGQAIKTWLDYPDNRELAKSTLDSKKRTLAALERQVGPDYLVDFLQYRHFEETMKDLAEGASAEENEMRRRRGLKARTGRGKDALMLDRSALTMFAKFMRVQGWVAPTFFPLERFTGTTKATEADKKPKRIVDEADIPRLLDAASERHPRARVLVAIGLFYGRRISDVLNIKWGQVDLVNSTMSYENVKRGKWVESKAFMGPLKAELENWLEWYEAQYGPVDPDWYLLPAKWKEFRLRQYSEKYWPAKADHKLWPLEPNMPSGSDSLNKDIQYALRGIGWTDLKGEGMHTLRRTAATLTAKHQGLGAAQYLLDHANVTVTQEYTRNRDGQWAYTEAVMNQDPWGVAPAPQPEPEPPSNVISMAEWRRSRRAG